MELHQCPCCDYFTLEGPRCWDICPICYWEDDGDYLDQPDFGSPANKGLSLRQARENFRLLGACETEMLEYVLPESKRDKYPRKVRQLKG
jgi:hypothetical protein